MLLLSDGFYVIQLKKAIIFRVPVTGTQHVGFPSCESFWL